MNNERIDLVIHELKTRTDINLNMAGYYNSTLSEGCLVVFIGLAAIKQGHPCSNLDDWDIFNASEWLQYDHSEHPELLCPRGYSDSDLSRVRQVYTREKAIAMLENLKATGKVDWNIDFSSIDG